MKNEKVESTFWIGFIVGAAALTFCIVGAKTVLWIIGVI